jgi:hypothetical protein
LTAMVHLELSRRRTGARRWRLYRDGAVVDRYVESFDVPSWSEHLRQHEERWTGSDRDVLDVVRRLATGDPVVEHLFPVEPA